MLEDDKDIHTVISLYDSFISDKNLAVIRTERLWKQFNEKDPYKDNVYLYIWYNKNGEPGGYIKYHAQNPGNGRFHMNVQELVWLNREALNGIFSFIGKLSAQIETFIWKAPGFLDLLPIFSEPYEINQVINPYGMNRIVNVKKALKLMSLPEGAGEIFLGVKDDFFSINSGCYKISWQDGKREVTKTSEAAGERTDLVCDVQSLSQIMTGFISIEDCKLTSRVEIRKNEASLSQVFPRKKLFINNYF